MADTPRFTTCEPVLDLFTTAYVLREVAVAPLPAARGLLQTAARFLADEQRADGLWCYYPRSARRLLPADLDTTACVADALLHVGCPFDEAAMWRTLPEWRHPDGGYWTFAMPPVAPMANWIYPITENNRSLTVNAHLWCLGATARRPDRELGEYLIDATARGRYREPDAYYDRPLLFLYNVVRAAEHLGAAGSPVLETVAAHLATTPLDVTGPPLERALALHVLRRCATASAPIADVAAGLLREQRDDGGWPTAHLYRTPGVFYGSRAVVTAICLHALAAA